MSASTADARLAAPAPAAGAPVRRCGSNSSSKVKSLMCGGVAGCVAKTATAPLSRFTVLAQTSTLFEACQVASAHGPLTSKLNFKNGKFVHGLTSLVRLDGVLALWKGNLLTCLHRFPFTGINFAVVECCWSWWPDRLRRSSVHALLPGALAGSCATVACYPLEVLRTHGMTRRVHQGRLMDNLSLLLRQEGVRGLYRGIDMALAVTVPSVAISFWVYRPLADRLSWMSPFCAYFVAGGVSGVAGSSITYPLDLLRRRLQVMSMDPKLPKHSWTVEASAILRREGPRGFYRGFMSEVTKVFPSVAIMFFVFELLERSL
mmetsp:Transcript_70497/g.215934  ORF Transcript_70497/g.215934 Transcript_70497/m.215934 type:complete len:318 (-) Transcript_70497:72-1025(-)